MILVARLLVQVLSSEPATLCFVDQATMVPITGAQVRSAGTASEQSVSLRAIGNCVRVVSGPWWVRRVGYRAVQIVARAGHVDTVGLLATTSARTALDTIRIASTRSSDAVARTAVTVSVADAQTTGATTASQLIDRLPLVQVHSARGETGLSLRGARAEQIVVTLDGLPLNDPATGLAEIADLPLSALSSATVMLGADPVQSGPGASAGVLALARSAERVATMNVGGFGRRAVEAGWSAVNASLVGHATVMHRTSTNDFPFVNNVTSAASGVPERRINNDESRTALSLGLVASRWQLFALASRAERGMVGPVNVRTYDHDRARRDRLLVRTQTMLPHVQLSLGARYFSLDYRDPTRSELNARSEVMAIDLALQGEAKGLLRRVATVSWRAGGGTDALRASGGITQSRARAFVAGLANLQRASFRVDFGARVDVIENAGAVPTLSVATERALGTAFSLVLRAAQAVRTPTLYDLYFSSPQRVTVRALRPERVTADLEIGARWKRSTAFGLAAVDASLVSRTTRDAIIWFPGNFGWSPANVGREQLRGGELRAQLSPRWGELSAWSTLYDTELTTGALRIPTPYVARVAFGSQGMLRLHGLTGSVLTRAFSRRPYSAGPRNRAFELPALALVDVSVAHPLPRFVQHRSINSVATWSIENAMNVEWQSVRGFPSPGRSWAFSILLRPASIP